MRLSGPFWPTLRLAFCLLALVHGLAGAQGDQTLRVVTDNSLAAPMATYADAQRSRISGGIVKDFVDALGRELKLPLDYRSVPTRRTGVALANGEADLLCFYAPAWLGEPDDPGQRRFLWTRPIVTDQDVLIQREGDPPAGRLEDLRGQTIGTVRGYVYPTLQTLVDAGQLVRDDTHSIESNLAKLRSARLYGAVVNEVNFRYLRRVRPDQVQGLRQTLTISEFELACAVSRRSRVSVERIGAAVEQLRTRGEVRRIYARYE